VGQVASGQLRQQLAALGHQQPSGRSRAQVQQGGLPRNEHEQEQQAALTRPIRDRGQASSRPSSAASHPLHAQHAAAQHDVNEREHSEPLSSLPLI